MGLKKLYCFSLFQVFLFACNEYSSGFERPDDLIDEEIMEEILYESILMETMSTFSDKNPNFIKILGTPYIFSKHNIDSSQLIKSEDYYTKNPRIYQKIYTKVLLRLKQDKDSIDKVIEEKKSK